MAAPRRTRAPLTALLLLVGSLACGRDGGAPTERRSVIVVSLDTLRRDHTSLYGYERDTTPALERLGQQSIVFQQAWSTWPWTLVAHVSMLTGLYPLQHGVMHQERALSPAIPLLAERLRSLGYRTVALHGPYWIQECYGFDRGFDVFRSHANAAEAERHLHEALAEGDPERPLFLFLHLFDIHSDSLPDGRLSFAPPEPYDTLFDPDAQETLASFDARDFSERDQKPSPEELAALRALYDGGVRYVDDMLGSWIEEWRESGLLDRSLLVVTSDHGENFGEHGALMRGHGSVYEEGLAIPLLMRLPDGERGGERPDAMVSLVDVVPTVLDWIGLPPDPRLPGTSLLGALPDERAVHGQNYRLLASLRWPLKVFRNTEERGGLAVTHLDRDPEEGALETLDAGGHAALYEEHPSFRPPWIGEEPFPAAVPLLGENPLLDDLHDLGYTGEH